MLGTNFADWLSVWVNSYLALLTQHLIILLWVKLFGLPCSSANVMVHRQIGYFCAGLAGWLVSCIRTPVGGRVLVCQLDVCRFAGWPTGWLDGWMIRQLAVVEETRGRRRRERCLKCSWLQRCSLTCGTLSVLIQRTAALSPCICLLRRRWLCVFESMCECMCDKCFCTSVCSFVLVCVGVCVHKNASIHLQVCVNVFQISSTTAWVCNVHHVPLATSDIKQTHSVSHCHTQTKTVCFSPSLFRSALTHAWRESYTQ